MPVRFPAAPPATRLLLVAGMGLALAACARQPVVTGSLGAPTDARDRHPIVMREGVNAIGIYPIRGPGGLDVRQREDLADFVETYRTRGRGRITLSVPEPTPPEVRQTLRQVRGGLKAMQIPAAYLTVTSHAAESEVAPVKLSYAMIEADVAGDCGKWTDDALGNGPAGFQNRPYDNFGCAYQRHIAVQVADPVDLARPKTETSLDIERQLKAIRDYRDGSIRVEEADATGG